jgi:hypothetical protein
MSRLGGSTGRATSTVLGASVGLTLLCWVLAAPPWAHHPEVTAIVRCDEATLEVSSWVGEPDDPATSQNELANSRTNPKIAILLSVDGGPYERLEQQPDWQFRAPDHTFGEVLPLPDPARTVSIRVDAAAPWASGAGPGNARTSPVVQVPPCGAPATRADPPARNAVDSSTTADAPGNGVRLLPWLSGAALVGAAGRVLRNLVRRAHGPLVR